jgi:hypothetical protein
MGGNPSPVECKREPATSRLHNLNAATYNYIMRWIALASITLTMILCLSDHTITVQSATIDRIYCELLNITNTLEINVEGGKHDSIKKRWEVWPGLMSRARTVGISEAYG